MKSLIHKYQANRTNKSNMSIYVNCQHIYIKTPLINNCVYYSQSITYFYHHRANLQMLWMNHRILWTLPHIVRNFSSSRTCFQQRWSEHHTDVIGCEKNVNYVFFILLNSHWLKREAVPLIFPTCQRWPMS